MRWRLLIGNDLEQSIISLYSTDLKAGYTILQISKLLNKAYPYINKKLNEFIASGIITKQNVGKSYLCHLNLASSQAIILLSIAEIRKLEEKSTQEHELEAVLSELKLIRKEFGILCAYETAKEILLIGDPKLQNDIASKAPLLHSKKFRVISQKDFSAKAIQVLLGFENYYNLAGEMQWKKDLRLQFF